MEEKVDNRGEEGIVCSQNGEKATCEGNQGLVSSCLEKGWAKVWQNLSIKYKKGVRMQEDCGELWEDFIGLKEMETEA